MDPVSKEGCVHAAEKLLREESLLTLSTVQSVVGTARLLVITSTSQEASESQQEADGSLQTRSLQ